ncbi:scarecrow-like protein 8 [Cynara cardunculus var. scolymus]|uniref:Transcription factor GRAS n=1 Tax=Cynara cardunculus var. scolymus TaxID=59895 RepID=A0A103YJI2_CYNCS|nr:scarecrow-like protein 8 [Cynara cardunculus var. scolymus]KVI10208.1 Transcription factor GRAS [Cynara cardunculus var. scolymus]
MSSGFSGGFPDFFNVNGGGVNNVAGRSMSMMNVNNVNRSDYRSQLAGILSDSSSMVSGSRSDLIGKRSLAEFQQRRQEYSVYLRNVKQRGYNQQASLVPPTDFLVSPEVSSVSNISSSSLSSVPRYGVPVLQQVRPPTAQAFNLGNGNFNGVMGSYQHNNRSNFSRISLPNLAAKQSPATQETEGKMMKRLQELEKQLLLDDEDGENDVSGVTNSEWSETIQNILGSTPVQKPDNTVSPSPTSSSSSSCASSSASPATTVCPKQLLSDAASVITDGKTDSAVEILTRVNQVSNALGTPEQRLSFYMAAALRSRMNANLTTASELYGKEHILSTQLLYDKSPCFKLAFMAANNTILELGQAEKKLHVVDFDIGQGVQYVYLLHEIAAARKVDKETPISLTLTTFTDFGNGGAERLKLVGDGLRSLSNKLGVLFSYNVLDFKLSDLSKEGLTVENDEVLAVNFAFKLNKLPDESVTTDNLRDEVLRRVKRMSPAVVTVMEQELNANTASISARVNDAFSYYIAFLNSLDATIPKENPERVKIEEGLSRRIFNSVACEGRDRVERCEVFGKWRARMTMAGFVSKPVSQLTAESLMSKLNSATRGNPGFTVKEDSGGINIGWLGRTLNVASAWH